MIRRSLQAPLEPGTDGAGRRSEADHHGGKITEHRAARADYGAPAYGDAGRDENIGRQPRFIFDHDWKSLDVKVCGSIIVRTGTEVALLRDHRILSNCNSCKAIENRMIPDPRIISDLQFPRIGNRHAGPNAHASANLGAELTQQPASKSIHHLRRSSEQRCLHQPPELNDESRTSSEIRRQPEGLEVLDVLGIQTERTLGFLVVTSFGDSINRKAFDAALRP
jgi:hypothetical protein